MTPLRFVRKVRLSRPFQWVFLLAAPGALWALWPEPARSPPLSASCRENWEGFLAIQYSGIRRNPGGRVISRERFSEHLLALASAGFYPIQLEEAQSFLLHRKPLPEKALLLILEDGRRETVQNAEEVLAPLRVPATLFLSLAPMERSSFLYPAWHDLRRLAATGRWAFSSKDSPALVEQVLSDRELVSHQEPPGPELIRPGIVPLSFSGGHHALNLWGSPADRLNCLHVDPEWSGEELAARLGSQWVRRAPYRKPSELDWTFRFGGLKVEGSRILLEASTKRRGAEAWLAGTESWRCVRGRATLECRPGVQAWVYLRGVPGKSFIRLGWTGRKIEVQYRLPGQQVRALAGGLPPGKPPQRSAAVSFDLLERQIRFRIEGGTAPARAFPLPRELEAGMAGLGTWLLDEADRAPVGFGDLELEWRPARALVIREIAEARSGDSEPIDVLAPRWYSVALEGGTPHLAGRSDTALSHLAAHRGAMIWPVISLGPIPAEASLASLVREIDRVASGPGMGGVLLDLRPLGSPSAPAANAPEDVRVGNSRVAEILEALASPAGVIHDPAFVQLPETAREKVSRIAATPAEVSGILAPPERLLLVQKSSR